MEKIFVAIASQLGVDKANLRFTFDGKRVQAGWLFFRHDYWNDCQKPSCLKLMSNLYSLQRIPQRCLRWRTRIK